MVKVILSVLFMWGVGFGFNIMLILIGWFVRVCIWFNWVCNWCLWVVELCIILFRLVLGFNILRVLVLVMVVINWVLVV